MDCHVNHSAGKAGPEDPHYEVTTADVAVMTVVRVRQKCS